MNDLPNQNSVEGTETYQEQLINIDEQHQIISDRIENEIVNCSNEVEEEEVKERREVEEEQKGQVSMLSDQLPNPFVNNMSPRSLNINCQRPNTFVKNNTNYKQKNNQVANFSHSSLPMSAQNNESNHQISGVINIAAQQDRRTTVQPGNYNNVSYVESVDTANLRSNVEHSNAPLVL